MRVDVEARMIRRAFIRRMMGAALASGLLGAELLTRRRDGWPTHTTAGSMYVFGPPLAAALPAGDYDGFVQFSPDGGVWLTKIKRVP